MRTDQLSDASISAEIAVKLARFHKMVMPFNKEPKWLFGTIDKWGHLGISLSLYVFLSFLHPVLQYCRLNRRIRSLPLQVTVITLAWHLLFSLRYMDQVMKLKFTRETHVKKYNNLMKLDVPAELESLRWVCGQNSVIQILCCSGKGMARP